MVRVASGASGSQMEPPFTGKLDMVALGMADRLQGPLWRIHTAGRILRRIWAFPPENRQDLH